MSRMSDKRLKKAAETSSEMKEKRKEPEQGSSDSVPPKAKRQRIAKEESTQNSFIMTVAGAMNDATGLKMQGSDSAKELESGFVPEKFVGDLKNDDNKDGEVLMKNIGL